MTELQYDSGVERRVTVLTTLALVYFPVQEVSIENAYANSPSSRHSAGASPPALSQAVTSWSIPHQHMDCVVQCCLTCDIIALGWNRNRIPLSFHQCPGLRDGGHCSWRNHYYINDQAEKRNMVHSKDKQMEQPHSFHYILITSASHTQDRTEQ